MKSYDIVLKFMMLSVLLDSLIIIYFLSCLFIYCTSDLFVHFYTYVTIVPLVPILFRENKLKLKKSENFSHRLSQHGKPRPLVTFKVFSSIFYVYIIMAFNKALLYTIISQFITSPLNETQIGWIK